MAALEHNCINVYYYQKNNKILSIILLDKTKKG